MRLLVGLLRNNSQHLLLFSSPPPTASLPCFFVFFYHQPTFTSDLYTQTHNIKAGWPLACSDSSCVVSSSSALSDSQGRGGEVSPGEVSPGLQGEEREVRRDEGTCRWVGWWVGGLAAFSWPLTLSGPREATLHKHRQRWCLDMKFNWGLLSLNLLVHQPSTLTHPQATRQQNHTSLTYFSNIISACSFKSTLKSESCHAQDSFLTSTACYGLLVLLESHAARRDSSSSSRCGRTFAARTNRVTLAPLWDTALLTAVVAHSSSTSCEILLLNLPSAAATDKSRRSVLKCVTVQTPVM